MIKALLFDYGGTLDTNGIHWSEKFWEVFQRNNIIFPKEEHNKAFVYAEPLTPQYIKPDDKLFNTLKIQIYYIIKYLNENKVHQFDNLEKTAIYLAYECVDDVLKNVETTKKILSKLKDNYKLGVVSNYYGNLESVLESLELKNFFDTIIDSSKVEVKKPDPKIFQIALERLKVNPDETIVIGDSYERDIKTSKSIGCRTIWFDGKSWSKPDDLSFADYIINSFDDILKIDIFTNNNYSEIKT